jgi:CheY-like chemotaxis protein
MMMVFTSGDFGQNHPPIPVQIRPGIPIILSTGFNEEYNEQHAKAMGIKGFLVKPVATGALAEMVRKVLDKVKGSTQQYVILSMRIQQPIF